MFYVLVVLVFVLPISLLLWMHLLERRPIEISRHSIFLRKHLKNPLNILHLTDTHFAKPDSGLSEFFERLSCERYDLVFLTGDIIDTPPGLEVCLENLKKLKPRLGLFAVFGNHDYYDYQLADMILHNFPGQRRPPTRQPAEQFQKEMTAAGIYVLRNETIRVHHGEEELLIHGLDDPTTGHANIRKTMEQFDPEKINILLSHSVDVMLDMGRRDIDVIFSGHSHGGQICFPVIGPLLTHTSLGKPYVSGVHRYQGTYCSVSRGVGESRKIPFRLNCKPEAILLTLHGKNK